MQMTGVERIKQYGNLEKEGEEHTPHLLPTYWPSEGTICYDHVTLTYLANPHPALKDLSFAIHGHEKVCAVAKCISIDRTSFAG